jgi:hypothetical protein
MQLEKCSVNTIVVVAAVNRTNDDANNWRMFSRPEAAR